MSENLENNIETKIYKLHYTPVGIDLSKEDIRVIEFSEIEEMVKYIYDVIYNDYWPKNYKPVILCACKNEIYVTENILFLTDFIANIYEYEDGVNDYDIYLYDFESYEEAYKCALSMKEEVTDKCYKKELK